MKDISAKTRVLGIIGHPIHHSLSPAMHNAALQSLGLDYRYMAFDVAPAALRRAVESIRALNFGGVNVTVPHKEKVIRYLDQLSPAARLIGAVNTIEHRDGRLIGHNTDGEGFMRAFRETFKESLRQKRVLLLGSGGAARAVTMSMGAEGIAEIIIANRTYSRARRLVKAISEAFPSLSTLAIRLDPDSMEKISGRADVIVNAISGGMVSDVELPMTQDLLRPSMAVCDLTYNPPLTPFLISAQEVGCPIMDGRGMLLYQGAIAFRIWTRVEPPIPLMRQALEKALSESYR